MEATKHPDVLLGAVEKLKKDGRRVEIVGKFENGKLELDSASVQALTANHKGGKFAFVAVNAPFAG